MLPLGSRYIFNAGAMPTASGRICSRLSGEVGRCRAVHMRCKPLSDAFAVGFQVRYAGSEQHTCDASSFQTHVQ